MRHFGAWWTLSEWQIIRPLPDALDDPASLRVGRRKFVLLFDDLDIYLRHDESRAAGVLQLVQALQHQAKELVVVATLRRTLPEFEALLQSPELLGRWRQIELPDWPFDSGQSLARQLNTDPTYWDGTPLSVIQPSQLMAARYRSAPAGQRKALRTLKLCFESGLYFVPRDLFIQLCATDASGVDPGAPVADDTLQELYDLGWLAPPSEYVQSFPALVPLLDDWSTSDASRELLRKTVADGLWHRQAAALGAACLRRDDQAGAHAYYTIASTIDPAKEAYAYRLGVVCGLMKDWSGAVSNFERAVNLKPLWSSAWYRLARARREMGDTIASGAAFKLAHALGSTDAHARYKTGELLRLEGKNEDAAEELAAALELNAKDTLAGLSYARVLKALGRWSEAEIAFARLISLAPQMPEAHFGSAEPLLHRGAIAEAERAYRTTLSLRPTFAEAYTYLAPLLVKTGRPEEAESVLAEGVRRCPDDARIHSFIGERLFRFKHDPVGAAEHFRRAVELWPSYVEAKIGLAGAYQHLGKLDGTKLDLAIALNLEVLREEPENVSALLGLGMCRYRQNRFSDAFTAFERIHKLSPTMGAAWYYAAAAGRSAGQPPATSLRFALQAMRCGFDKFRCLVELARNSVALGLKDEALDQLTQAVATTKRGVPRWLQSDPDFAPLWHDARFAVLFH
jgi:tetratricopeptide (TPR) repeat protein